MISRPPRLRYRLEDHAAGYPCGKGHVPYSQLRPRRSPPLPEWRGWSSSIRMGSETVNLSLLQVPPAWRLPMLLVPSSSHITPEVCAPKLLRHVDSGGRGAN